MEQAPKIIVKTRKKKILVPTPSGLKLVSYPESAELAAEYEANSRNQKGDSILRRP